MIFHCPQFSVFLAIAHTVGYPHAKYQRPFCIEMSDVLKICRYTHAKISLVNPAILETQRALKVKKMLIDVVF